ncbi:hypothetical protein ADUPG1_009561, partial [Aduncisulcus paluster]
MRGSESCGFPLISTIALFQHQIEISYNSRYYQIFRQLESPNDRLFAINTYSLRLFILPLPLPDSVIKSVHFSPNEDYLCINFTQSSERMNHLVLFDLIHALSYQQSPFVLISPEQYGLERSRNCEIIIPSSFDLHEHPVLIIFQPFLPNFRLINVVSGEIEKIVEVGSYIRSGFSTFDDQICLLVNPSNSSSSSILIFSSDGSLLGHNSSLDTTYIRCTFHPNRDIILCEDRYSVKFRSVSAILDLGDEDSSGLGPPMAIQRYSFSPVDGKYIVGLRKRTLYPFIVSASSRIVLSFDQRLKDSVPYFLTESIVAFTQRQSLILVSLPWDTDSSHDKSTFSCSIPGFMRMFHLPGLCKEECVMTCERSETFDRYIRTISPGDDEVNIYDLVANLDL